VTTDQPGDARAVATEDSWKPRELREAEARLDATLTRSRELEEELEQLELAQEPPSASPGDIAAIKAQAERADAPDELRIIKLKVDAGELTWKDVLEGRAYRDEDVRNALSAQLGQLSEVYQDFEDGHTLDEVLESAGLTGPLNDTGADYPTPPTAEQAEEDYFGTNSALADSGTPPESSPSPPPAPASPPQPPSPPQPEPPSPPIRRRPSSAHPEDDDYFGGSPLGE
jgi:hypothetical protein